MACEATFIIWNANGEQSLVTMAVPDYSNEMTKEQLIDYITTNYSNSLVLELIKAVNASGLRGKYDSFKDSALYKDLPLVGNYNINTLVNKYYPDFALYFLDYTNEEYVPDTIIVTDRVPSAKLNINGKGVVILPDNKSTIRKYIEYCWVLKTLATNENLIKLLNNAYKTKSFDKGLEKHYFDRRSGNQYSVELEIKKCIDAANLLYQEDLTENSEINKIIKRNTGSIYEYIPIEDFVNYLKKHNLYSEQIPLLNLIASFIHSINNEPNRSNWILIENINSNNIVFRRTKLPITYTATPINLSYYDDLTVPVKLYKGYTIVRYLNKFYISNLNILHNAQSVENKLGFSTLLEAIKRVNKIYLHDKLFASFPRLKLKQTGLLGNAAITYRTKSKKELEEGQLFKVLNIDLGEAQVPSWLHANDTTYSTIMLELKKQHNLTTEQLSQISNIELAETLFILLHNNPNEQPLQYIDLVVNSEYLVYKYIGNSDLDLHFELVEPQKIEIPTVLGQSFREDLIYLAGTLEKSFGIKIHLINEADLYSSKLKNHIKGNNYVKAFILNGEIYVNIDKARTSDLLHEYAHLILGAVKNNSKTALIYYSLVNRVTLLNNYLDWINARRASKDYRAVTDLNEELLVQLFTEYCEKKTNSWFTGKEDDLELLKQAFKGGLQKFFMTNIEPDDSDLQGATLLDIFEGLGSYILNFDSNNKDYFKETITLRKITNYIKREIKENRIKEECK